MRGRASVFCSVILLAGAASWAGAPFYEVVEITTLVPPGQVWGINGQGSVVGWSASQGWVYSDIDGLVPLSDLVAVPLPTSAATAINDGFAICGGASGQGFVIDPPDLLELPPVSDLPLAAAHDLNEAGLVVGNSNPEPGKGACCSRATAWSDGEPQDLGLLAGFSHSSSIAVNEAGQIVGSSYTCNFPLEPICEARPTLWQDGSMQDLGLLAGFDNSRGRDINDLGEVTGFGEVTDRTVQHGFLRTPDGTFIDLGELPDRPFTEPRALNNLGAVVGSTWGQEVPFTGTYAFLWQDGVLYDLNDAIPAGSGWILRRAVDINDAGQIAVVAWKEAEVYALRLDPDDEPPVPAQSPVTLIVSTLLLLGAGFLVLRSLG